MIMIIMIMIVSLSHIQQHNSILHIYRAATSYICVHIYVCTYIYIYIHNRLNIPQHPTTSYLYLIQHTTIIYIYIYILCACVCRYIYIYIYISSHCRNAYLAAKANIKPPTAMKSGTTICGIQLKDMNIYVYIYIYIYIHTYRCVCIYIYIFIYIII